MIGSGTRLGLIAGFSLVFAALEVIWPLRKASVPRTKRWPGNISLFLFDVFVVGLPVNAAVFAALSLIESRHLGLLNLASLPLAAKILIGILALDAMFYFQHRLSHRVQWLWRLHAVHHADIEMDVTTANRVHPLESLWVAFLRISLALLLGIPEIAFVIFLVLLNTVSLFNHTNLFLPTRFERVLRLVLVTPRMHETHHSRHASDFDTNFSFVFSFWDRLFATYKRSTTKLDHGVELGLDGFRALQDFRLPRLLTMPFRAAG